jgi:hypothetical protein
VVISASVPWRERLGRVAVVTATALGPAGVWYLLAPGSLGSSHIRGGDRAGLDELLLSVDEAGVTLARGVFLPSAVRYALGLVLLVGPVVLVALTGARAGAGSRRERSAAHLRSSGLGPWLWFLVAYTALVVLQRWGIDREVIARYWLPYWVVATVLVGRCLADWRLQPGRGWRTASAVAWVSLVGLAGYNTAQVASTAWSNARDLFAALATGSPDVVHTDDRYLVSFQLYARGALAPVERLRCRADQLDPLVASLEAQARRGEDPAVAVLGRCRGTPFVAQLLVRLDGARVREEPGLGVVIWPDG